MHILTRIRKSEAVKILREEPLARGALVAFVVVVMAWGALVADLGGNPPCH
jgi:hypothetical protein